MTWMGEIIRPTIQAIDRLKSMKVILDLPDEQQTDEILYRALAQVTEAVRDLTSLLDDFEDFQETLALGLSAEFRKDIEAAKLASIANETRSS